jgi:hypothetical protein
MTKRDELGRFTTATPEDDGQTVGNFVRETLARLLTIKPVLGYAVAGVVGTFAIAGWAFAGPHWSLPESLISFPSKDVCPLPQSFWITTWDSSEADPAKRVQHKLVKLTRCDATKAYGTYEYVGSPGNGEVTVIKRMGDTVAINFWSEKADGPGLGTVIVRPLAHRDTAAGTVWSGIELGHDCTCGTDYAGPGPFTSVPATVTESRDPPPEFAQRAATAVMQPEIKFFPEDLFGRPGQKPAS